MSAHVLLNLLKELRKRDKMRGLQSILSLFRNELNKFNNTGARMLDYIYHMALKHLFFYKENSVLPETAKIFPYYRRHYEWFTDFNAWRYIYISTASL